MSWTEANIARRRNITDLTRNISQTAGDIAALREARKRRRQEAMQGLGYIFMQFGGQKWQSEEAQKERDWRTGERVGTQEYGAAEAEKERGWKTGESAVEREWRTGESAAEREWKSSEAEKERGLTREEWPWHTKWATAGRAEQNVYAGGDDKLAAFDKGFNAWIDKVGAQNPDWFIRDEYGEVVGYNIPDEGWNQFKSYMQTLYPNISAPEVDAYIDSIRAIATEAPEVPVEEVGTGVGQAGRTEQLKIYDLLQGRGKLNTFPGMSRDQFEIAKIAKEYLQDNEVDENEKGWLLEHYPQIMEIIQQYKSPAQKRAPEEPRQIYMH